MGVITTIDDTKTCRTKYDELLVKEVIRSLCGTSDSIDIEVPPEPPIIEPEEPPFVCTATSISFDIPEFRYAIQQAVTVNSNIFDNVQEILDAETNEEQLEAIISGFVHATSGTYPSLSDKVDEEGMITTSAFGNLGRDTGSFNRYFGDEPEKILNNISISTKFSDIYTPNYLIKRDASTDEITYDVGDPLDLEASLQTHLPNIVDEMVLQSQTYLNTRYPVDKISFGDLLRGHTQYIEAFEGMHTLRAEYRKNFGDLIRLYISSGVGILARNYAIITGKWISSQRFGSGYAAFVPQYFVNWMKYREPYDVVLDNINLTDVSCSFYIVKQLVRKATNPQYKHLDEVIWVDNETAHYDLSNLGK